MRPHSAFGPVVPVPAGATCPRHPASTAIAACRRCGTFVCVADRVSLDGSNFCRDCAARPDVDYLEAYRLKYWGKRDSWAWFFGVGAILNTLLGLATLGGAAAADKFEPSTLFLGLVLLSWAAVAGAFWAGVRAARQGLLAVLVVYAVVLAAAAGPAVAALIFPAALVVSALSSVRTKLFFKMHVPREQLRKTWALLHDNVLARHALLLGVTGLIIGPFAPLGVVLGVIALRRVDPTAFPPIGRKAHAIAGIVLGALGTLVWGGVAIAFALGKT